MTLADIYVFRAMRASDTFDPRTASVTMPHVSRWYKHCEKLPPLKISRKKRLLAVTKVIGKVKLLI